MWELDYKESWALKNWSFWTVVLEKTLESPLHYKEIKPVHPKENQSLIFIGRTDADAEAPTLWPPDVKNWLNGKDPDAGKDWRQEEKGTTEDEMVGCHHRLDGHEFEQALGVGDGQGDLVCCSPWGHKESDTTEGLNWLIQMVYLPFSPLPFASLLFSAICKSSSDNHLTFLHFFLLGMVSITASIQCYKPLSIALQALCLPLTLLVTSTA